jgi:hypothetical protein
MKNGDEDLRKGMYVVCYDLLCCIYVAVPVMFREPRVFSLVALLIKYGLSLNRERQHHRWRG